MATPVSVILIVCCLNVSPMPPCVIKMKHRDCLTVSVTLILQISPAISPVPGNRYYPALAPVIFPTEQAVLT